MKYCKNCQKELEKKEETFKDGICFECYQKYLLDKARKLSRGEYIEIKEHKILNFFKKHFKK